jgi:hypothetical protein
MTIDDDRDIDFKDGLKSIENKYIKFFKARKTQFIGQKHDELTNHVSTLYNNNTKTITLRISGKDKLPENIQKEVEELFIKVWQIISANKQHLKLKK